MRREAVADPGEATGLIDRLEEADLVLTSERVAQRCGELEASLAILLVLVTGSRAFKDRGLLFATLSKFAGTTPGTDGGKVVKGPHYEPPDIERALGLTGAVKGASDG